ncbi:hypothetical protein [Cohnella zeiphila]|uniref:Uncharacterized protein n=1 Tax=Cohnella zeiphila TaxID=2761120 RepID=A0A7X0SQ80_9BACL|nr:hypothetical protein [Cohnella zeiphila]MBB6731883.1 hypothetical protein [Cohnella zeiphila]
MSFWAQYVVAKEEQGVSRADSLAKIEAKYGAEFRASIEAELPKPEEGVTDGN